MGFLVYLFIFLWIKNNLGDTLSVPQIHEYDASVISSALYPSHEHHLFTKIVSAKLVAVVCPSHFS
jgi:hypothetical protein